MGIRCQNNKLSENIQKLLENCLKVLLPEEKSKSREKCLQNRKRPASVLTANHSSKQIALEKEDYGKRRRVMEPYYFLNRNSPLRERSASLICHGKDLQRHNNDENSSVSSSSSSDSSSGSAEDSLTGQCFTKTDTRAEESHDELRDAENRIDLSSSLCNPKLPVIFNFLAYTIY